MLMSTKGMSVVASRKLLDDLAARVAAGRIDKILVAHDFDVSGFGIFATLGGQPPIHVHRRHGCRSSTSACGSRTSAT